MPPCQRRRTARSLTGLLAVALALAGASGLEAQSISRADEIVKWSAPGEKGVSASIRVVIHYSRTLGEPTYQTMAEATTIDWVMVDGQRVTRADVGDAVWNKLEIINIDASADIYSGNHRVSTVSFTNLIDVDFKGSKGWDGVFPGLDAKAAKDLYERGFSIRNVRVTDAFVSGGASVSLALREQRAAQERADAERAKAERAAAQARLAEQQRAAAAARTQPATTSPARSASPAPASGRAPRTSSEPLGTASGQLSSQKQRAFEEAISNARAAEKAGNQSAAIVQYQFAYNISPEPWVDGRMRELINTPASGAGSSSLSGFTPGSMPNGASAGDERWLLIGSGTLNMLSSMSLSEDDAKTVGRLQKTNAVVDMMQANATSSEEVEALNKLEGVAQAVIIGASFFGGGDDDEEEKAPAAMNASQKQARQLLLGLQKEVSTAYARYEGAAEPSTLAELERTLSGYHAFERQSAPARLLLLLWYEGLPTAPDEATVVRWRQQIAALQEAKGLDGVIAAVDEMPGVPHRYRANLPFLLNAEDAFGEQVAALERRRATLEDPQAEARAAEAALASNDHRVMAEHLRRFDSPRAAELQQRSDAFRRIDYRTSDLRSEVELRTAAKRRSKRAGIPLGGVLLLLGLAVGEEMPWMTYLGVGAVALPVYMIHHHGKRIDEAHLELQRLQQERAELVR